MLLLGQALDLVVGEVELGRADGLGTIIAPIASILSPMSAAWAMLDWRRASGSFSHGLIDGFVSGVCPCRFQWP